MMSDMKLTKPKPPRKATDRLPDTFTVRDMSRNAATVLRASLEHGQVRIKSRAGTAFVLTPDKTEERIKERVRLSAEWVAEQKAYREKLRALGSRPPAVQDMEHINRIIAGEI